MVHHPEVLRVVADLLAQDSHGSPLAVTQAVDR
jgi:hypothetical protein